ncbi:MAG TPA: M28 family peptidase [Gemmatimonadaceae bacterium]|nr:M28 family peptidase [Gemmatimonadaceae bacterium]
MRHHRTIGRAAAVLAALVLCAAPLAAQTTTLPLKHAPRPTTAGITAADLMTRLYIFADDSMLGRRAGEEGNLKGTAYIANELRRIGLQPAGDSGTYFQNVPLVERAADSAASHLAANGTTFAYGSDFIVLANGESATLDNVPAIFGGVMGSDDMLPAEQGAGKVVVFALGRGFRIQVGPEWSDAAGILVVALDRLPPQARGFLARPSVRLEDPATSTRRAPAPAFVSNHVAEVLFGKPIDSVSVGTTGGTVQGAIVVRATAAPARNVVAILPGSDPKLKGEYVAIGAHNDHIGIRHPAVDADSLRAFNQAAWVMRDSDPNKPAPPRSETAQIRVNMDSLRQIGPAHLDSINNGADDDGSGSVTVLEIAQNLAASRQRPKRSILFVWHTGEELGLLGSRWYTDHPTVPRDSIVAQLNMDMVGRGDSTDLAGGGPGYLELVGSRRLSTELGDIVEEVNKRQPMPLTFDYRFDANGHPERIYCRSDHYMYARYGIPIVFFTTGLHADYHQVTDEPQYIDYEHMARVANFVRDVALTVANLDHRPVVDKPKPDPNGQCVQ